MRVCTTGVIILAGEQDLMQVAGAPLLHRLLLNGHQAGIQEWSLLSWGDTSKAQDSLASDPRLADFSWQIYELHQNDVAVLPPPHLQPAEDLLVMSSAAVFDRRLLPALQHREGSTLSVIPAWAQTQGPGVQVREGRITAAMSADAVTHRAVGLIRCSGALWSHLIKQVKNTIANGSEPLQPFVTALLNNATTPINAFEVQDYAWTTISEPTMVAAAESRLLRQLGREGDSPIVRWVARRASRALTRHVMHTRITPNHITVASGVLGVSGAAFLVQPDMLWQVVGCLLFLLSTIIDGCDGELARLTFQESAFGAKLDVTMDNIVHGALFPAIAIGLYRQDDNPLHLILGALALGGIVVSMLVFLPHVLRPEVGRTAQTRLHESLASRDFAYALPILALFHKLDWFLWATAIGAYVFAGAWIIISWRQRRKASYEDTPG